MYSGHITILVTSSTPWLYAYLRVATRVYDVEGGAIFSKNSTFVFFDGAPWTPRLRSPSPIMAPGETKVPRISLLDVLKNKELLALRAPKVYFLPTLSNRLEDFKTVLRAVFNFFYAIVCASFWQLVRFFGLLLLQESFGAALTYFVWAFFEFPSLGSIQALVMKLGPF